MEELELEKAEDYLNKEIGFVKNTLISYNEVIKAMAKFAKSEELNLQVISNTFKGKCKSDIKVCEKRLLKLKEKGFGTFGNIEDGEYNYIHLSAYIDAMKQALNYY